MAKSIDEKTRKLASQRPETGKEFQQMQAAQNQLLEIQAAQKQNLMEQKMMAGAEAEQRQLMAQAAEVGAGSVAGNMQLNQATQQAMGRYGLAQPRTSSTTKQTQSQSVTRQNVTIHNNTTNITNNTVPANIGGPIQGRPIQFQQPVPGADASGGMGKFKNWLNQTFARQEEAAKRRNREYERRETSLTKNSNKMMRKIEEFSKDITKKLDPRNVGKTVGGQLRTILGILGLGIIAKNFNKLLDWLEGAQNKVENEYIPNIKNFFAWVKGDEDARRPGFVTKLTEGIEKTFGKLLYGKDYTPNGSLAEGGLLKSLSKYFWNTETGENRGVLNKAFDYIKEEFQRRSKMAKESITLDKSETFWDIIHNPGAAFKEFLTNLTNYLGVLVGGDAVLSRIQGKTAEAKAVKETTSSGDASATYDSSGYQRLSAVRTPGGVRKAYTADAGLLEFENNYNKTSQYIISKHYLDKDGGLRRGDLGATTQVSNNLLYHNKAAQMQGRIETAAVANDLHHLYTEARSNGEVLVNSANFNIKVKNGIVLGKFLADHGLIRQVEKGELRLILRNRPQEELEHDLKEITPHYKKVAEVLRKLGLNGIADLTEGKIKVLGIEAQFPTQFLPDLVGMIESGVIALVEEKIVRPEEINPAEGDIEIRDVSEEISRKGYVWAKPEAISALAYYGYMTEEDRQNKALEDITFNLSDKEFLGSIQRALESRASSITGYDYDASGMADNKRAENYQKEAPKDVEYAGKLVREEPTEAAPTGKTGGLMTKEQIEAAEKAEKSGAGKTGGLLTQEQIDAGVTRGNGGSNSGSSSSSGRRGLLKQEELDAMDAAGNAASTATSGEVTEASGQEPFINAVMPIIKDSLGRAGISEDFVPMLTAQSGVETGWRIGKGILQKEGKNLSGIIAPNMDYRGTPGKNGDIRKGGGVGGRDAIYARSNTGDGINWYTKFASYGDWADYVISLVKKKWDAFSGAVTDYPHKILSGGQKYATDPNYASKLLSAYYSVSNYLKTGKYTPVKIKDTPWSGSYSSDSTGGTDAGDGFFGKVKSKASDFFDSAKEVVKDAIGGLVHKVGEGTEFEADLHGGLANYDYGTRGRRSDIEEVMYGKYSGNERQLYDVLPKSIIKGTTSDRNEWWGGFFDHEGNLKIKDSDKVNPEIMKALTDIEGELKKGNGMDEVQLQLAATSLDNAMQYNAGQTARERRLINALTVPQPTSVPSMTENNTNGI